MASVAPVDFLSGLGPLPKPYDAQQQVLQDQQHEQAGAQQLQFGAAKLSALQAQQQQEQDYQRDVQNALHTGQFGPLYAKYPDKQKELQAAHEALDEPARRTQERDLYAVSSYIKNGAIDSAKTLLQKRIDADKAAGGDFTDDQQMLDALNSGDPKQVQAAADMALFAILPADKRAELFGKPDANHFTSTSDGAIYDQRTGDVSRRAPDRGVLREIKVVDPETGQETTQFVRVGGSEGGGPASTGGAPSGSGGAPLSVRLNNPGAIRFSPSNDWQGQVGNEGGFVKFATQADGERAQRKLIANQIKAGYDTPLEWANHYAPASDGNDPQAYATRIAKGLGIGVNDTIPIGAVPKMAAISAAVERGGTPAPAETASGQPGVVASFVTKKAGANESGLDDASIQFYGERVAAGDDLPALGSGKAAAAARQAILKKAAEINRGEGMTGADSSLRRADVRSARQALTQLQKTRSNVQGFERTFMLNVDQVLKTAPKGVGGSAPVFNRWIQAGRKSINGDPDVSRFNVAINTAANEYAKLASGASGGAVTSDSARHEAMEILNNAQTLPQLQAAIQQMKIDGHNRILALNEQESRLRGTILNKPVDGGGAPKGPPKVGEVVRGWKFKGGDPKNRDSWVKAGG